MKIQSSIVGLLLGTTVATAQIQNRPPDATLNPCPGGTTTVELDPVGGTPTLNGLVQMSELVIVGTVVNVLPAFSPSVDHLDTVKTESLVAVEQLLYGSLPLGTKTILLSQLGGRTGVCALVVPDDPLVKNGERYVLFLRADNQTEPPNTSGSPRYFAAGVWSGKAKIVNGKMQFLPRAHADLRKYGNTDANAFIETLKGKINVLLPKQ